LRTPKSVPLKEQTGKLPVYQFWKSILGLYKTSVYSRGKDAMTKDLKLEI
jgi:hypothetical protein